MDGAQERDKADRDEARASRNPKIQTRQGKGE
jgi:hypothetical protein